MVRQFSSFSPCGKNFVSCGADGKLKLWDTLSGVLKQEFVPNLHLSQPCTSFAWLRFDKSVAVQWKKKKLRTGLKGSHALALGTHNGIVAIYHINEAKVTCTLKGGHSTCVSCLTWNKSNDLFSASENTVVIWDLPNKTVKSKWKCGKGKITCIEVSDDGELCITGSFKLKIWNVQSKELVKELTGHSSDVSNIQFISNSKIFMSTACSDRYVSVWNLDEESDDPVGRFVLGDAVQGFVSSLDNDDSTRLAATCCSGVLHYFSHQFNGSRSKAIKPAYKLEIASGSRLVNGSGSTPNKSSEIPVSSEVSRIPIIAVYLLSAESARIAYGQSPSITFETVKLENTKESACLVRAPTLPVSPSKSKSNDEPMVEDAEYIGGGIVGGGGGGKRLRDCKGKEVPLEERLNNLSTQDLTGCVEQDMTSPHSMANLLAQALQSKDKSLLETVLFRKELSVIKQTVSRLPVNLIPLLIRELFIMVQGKAITSSIAVVWLQCLLTLNSSQLLADRDSLHTLSDLHSLVETRLAALPRLFRLSGRLDLLLQQVHGQFTIEADQAALLVYQDEDSSEEGSSMAGDGPEVPSESEDKWDELSDLDTEEMST